MTTGFFEGPILRGLAFQVLLFLSLALLPIGLIAVVQTREIIQQSSEAARLSLLAVTEQEASAERLVLQEALGAAQALASIVSVVSDDSKQCSAFMKAYAEASEYYAVVGFIDTRGVMACSSTGNVYNFAQDPAFQAALLDPQRRASGDSAAPLFPRPFVTITVPVWGADVLKGFVSIVVPNESFAEARDDDHSSISLTTVAFSRTGELLTADTSWEVARAALPRDELLADNAGRGRHVFTAESASGDRRVYAVMPLVPGVAYAMSVWPLDTPLLQTDLSSRLTGVLPVVMWLASLVVAFWALNRLAITHIRKLGRQMRRFARNRTLPQNPLGGAVPTEIYNMEEAFVTMAESILRDEAAIEDSLREKNILLKEVHHRVKNNLQLISSMMNMQIRQADSPESERVLKRLQDRILGLATVHQSLYQGADFNQVNGGKMLREIVNQVLSFGLEPGANVDVVQSYEDVLLQPDDAAPLTLLVSEALTNALKYVAPGEDGRRRIRIGLRYLDPTRAELEIANTSTEHASIDGTGLGSKLILAFTRQLNGQIETGLADGYYRTRLDFPVPQHAKPVYDY